MLTPDEKQRYQRQILLSGWGEEGQEKIKRSTVFIAGAGGLAVRLRSILLPRGLDGSEFAIPVQRNLPI